MTTDLIASGFSHYVIIGCSVFGLVWGGINACFVSTSPRAASLMGAPRSLFNAMRACSILTPAFVVSRSTMSSWRLTKSALTPRERPATLLRSRRKLSSTTR